MSIASKEYIINTVFRTNTLPVISECNTNCIFCSHKQNPQNVETFRMPKLELEDFKEIIKFLSPRRKIVIGEAATRIVEGEPFLYKDILPLLAMVRKKFADTTIQVTTNGTLLDEKTINCLKDLGDIELNISLNCVDSTKRRIILGKGADLNIKEKILLLKDNVIFSGSCVIVPDMITYSDLEDIVSLLYDCGAQIVRVFLPGYTKKSEQTISLKKLHDEIVGFVAHLRDKYPLPIIVEPAIISDLQCRLEGIIQHSPAALAGLKHGDILEEVNGRRISTRVEAFDLVYRSKNPALLVRRNEEQFKISLIKGKNTSPGFVVLFDIEPEVCNQIQSTVEMHGAKRVLFITSELAFKIIREFLDKSDISFSYDVVHAENEFFGGTIKCAGLLTTEDIIKSAEGYLENRGKPDLILLPPIMFDSYKRDLLGSTIKEIEKKIGIPVDTI